MDFSDYGSVKELVTEKALLERLLGMWQDPSVRFDNVTVVSDVHPPFTVPLKDIEAMGTSLEVPADMKENMVKGLTNRLEWVHGELVKKGVTGLEPE
jgi:hypothetical protein